MDGQTTANHVRVAGTLTDTTIANRTLVVEATGLVAGSITYQELEIKKGGSLQGGIYKVGREKPTAPARAPEPQRTVAPEPAPAPEAAAASATDEIAAAVAAVAAATPSVSAEADTATDAPEAAAPESGNNKPKT
jgi:hypothetical protein